ncbi:MAG: type II toxin-antitoxin system HicB family antitoxin [Nitrosomonas sp.]|nr:type II toxin-antitoxin system HicB family antitoxin [Nitrosomonas sp.]
MELSAVLTPAPEGGYVAFNPETGTTTQGETVEEALANLAEATELYLEEFPMTTVSCSMLTTPRFLEMFKLPVVSKGE